MAEVIVTTVKDKPHLIVQARELARRLGCPYVQRGDKSLARLTNEYGQQITVIVGDKRISAIVGEEEFFFHPSMALLRLMNYRKGEKDRLAEAMDLQDGMHILDCTLGFATDALVASYLSGPTGSVTGLEASPVVASLVAHGIATFKPNLHSGLDPVKAQVLADLPHAMARIKIVNTSYQNFLRKTPDKSFDVVYFDPMFRTPLEESSSMASLRRLACPEPIDRASVQQALRVARRRVVLKEGRYSHEFARLGFKILPGGKYSHVAYGVIEL